MLVAKSTMTDEEIATWVENPAAAFGVIGETPPVIRRYLARCGHYTSTSRTTTRCLECHRAFIVERRAQKPPKPPKAEKQIRTVFTKDERAHKPTAFSAMFSPPAAWTSLYFGFRNGHNQGTSVQVKKLTLEELEWIERVLAGERVRRGLPPKE